MRYIIIGYTYIYGISPTIGKNNRDYLSKNHENDEMGIPISGWWFGTFGL